MSIRYYSSCSILFGNSLFLANNDTFSKCCQSVKKAKNDISILKDNETVQINDTFENESSDNSLILNKNNHDIKNNEDIQKNNKSIKKIDNLEKEQILFDQCNSNIKTNTDKKNNEDNNRDNENYENMTLYDVNKFYIVFKDNNLKDNEIDILEKHYKNENRLLGVDKYESLLKLMNEEFSDKELLKLIKSKLNYNNYEYKKFNDTVLYENERISFKNDLNEYAYVDKDKKENITNSKHGDSIQQILLDIYRIGNLVNFYIFNNNENSNNFNNYIIRKREEDKFRKALAKVLVNAVLNYDLKYYQGMDSFAQFFILLTAEKEDKYVVKYNEEEALKLFILFLNMKFDKIIIDSSSNIKEFKIIDFYDRNTIKNVLQKMIVLLNMINNNLQIDTTVNKEYMSREGNEYNKILSSLVGILHNFNITKVKTYNDLRKMFLLLFLTHNYNVIFDIFSISTLKYLTSNKTINDEFLIDMSLK